MHALLPHAAGRCLASPQLRSQRSSSNSRCIFTSPSNDPAVRAPWSNPLQKGSSSSSSSRLCSSSQSQADVANQDSLEQVQQFSAIDSTVEALLTAELEAEGEEPLEVDALVAAAAAGTAQQQAADKSQDENPYSPEDALR